MFLSWATSSIMNVSRSDGKKKERTSSLKTCGQFHEPHRYGASMKRELPSRNIGRSTSLLPEAPPDTCSAVSRRAGWGSWRRAGRVVSISIPDEAASSSQAMIEPIPDDGCARKN